MCRTLRPFLLIAPLTFLWAQHLAGAAPELPESTADRGIVERFLAQVEKPPVRYRALRRLEAASPKLNESAWLEAVTEYDPAAGFQYTIAAHGGSDRIMRRVLAPVLEKEREQASREEWRKSNLSRANYDFGVGGRTPDGFLKMQLMPRRKDSRLVLGSVLVTATSGDLVRIDGRLSKSPSFWVKWVDVSRTYAPVGGLMMPIAVESTADVRIAGMSTFSMTYDYEMVDGRTARYP
jgi:hypothetical protein